MRSTAARPPVELRLVGDHVVAVAGNAARLAERGTGDRSRGNAEVLHQAALRLQEIHGESDRAAATNARDARQRREVLNQQAVGEPAERDVLQALLDASAVASAAAAAAASSALSTSRGPAASDAAPTRAARDRSRVHHYDFTTRSRRCPSCSRHIEQTTAGASHSGAFCNAAGWFDRKSRS